jgi:two-component system, cell cycle sensor histidine kinase and response regulator CckA
LEGMLKRLIAENVSLTRNCAPDLYRVKVDAGQLEQVIMNLVINARDAISAHGKITLETANVNLDESYARSHSGVKPGRYVMLAVSDTGCGMTDDIKAHIFEPFFTTKEQGKGTGLGLATVYGIIKQSGGQIEVYSEIGKGTTFKIYFPQVAGEIAPMKSNQTLPGVAQGNEVILVVEDDEGVRELVIEILTVYGYKVLIAGHGNEALAVCGSHKGPIELLMTDMVMPEMNGPELAERIRAIRPEIKVLFTSGYTEHAVVNNGMLSPEMNFLHKPFTPQAVARKVREVLDFRQENSKASQSP